MDRRTFIVSAGIAAQAVVSDVFADSTVPQSVIPIIDTHIHLYDPNRPQGTPVVIPGSPTARTGSLPGLYSRLAAPLGVVGAIHVEASNWVEDNLWALETAATSDIMVGVIGNLDPLANEFGEYLERYHRNPAFRGIRYGNIWGYDLASGSRNRTVLDRLKLLAQADLVMDSATPDIELLQGLLRINDAIPDLRIVIDHLPAFEPTSETAGPYESLLRELHRRPTLFMKLSQIIHRVNGKVSIQLADYRARLDHLFEIFGEDRITFGSDYPNSDMTTAVPNVFAMARAYCATRTTAVVEKLLWSNSQRIYKWTPRTAAQAGLK